MNKLACYDCGRLYGDEYGFPDLVLPDEIWNDFISPNHDESGLLCPSCICKRAYEADLVNVPAVFRSGPLAIHDSAEYHNGVIHERNRILALLGDSKSVFQVSAQYYRKVLRHAIESGAIVDSASAGKQEAQP